MGGHDGLHRAEKFGLEGEEVALVTAWFPLQQQSKPGFYHI
ncbi:hypothetical protein DAQ1742_02538 [Dickeya aquatica]|uniref:Uncharacterized protein n=1 Tax=Dickeya aquatica TaxID=1401087 RepID=A0A375ABX3_9GAMM|nr:hypothetical protein DAQ1742_02538 [Dickeya aquatica]